MYILLCKSRVPSSPTQRRMSYPLHDDDKACVILPGKAAKVPFIHRESRHVLHGCESQAARPARSRIAQCSRMPDDGPPCNNDANFMPQAGQPFGIESSVYANHRKTKVDPSRASALHDLTCESGGQCSLRSHQICLKLHPCSDPLPETQSSSEL